MSGNTHIKQTQAAKRFANENNLYGIRFVCFYKEWCIFVTNTPPGVLVDLAWPPTYILVENDLSVRWSTEKEGIEIYNYLESINWEKPSGQRLFNRCCLCLSCAVRRDKEYA